ncbi:hypothetical protein [Glycomyces sp. NPDC047010]|uniref:hypothetical protein n=1 Tax=Glycomyces sp. NPDC047010 TaxID=3155023 RepID=UPI0033C4EA93
MNPLQRLLLGPGRLPDGLAASLRAEGMVILVEGAVGTVTHRHLRAPGRRANWKKTLVTASIAVSTKRFVVNVRRYKHIDVPIPEMPHYKVVATNPEPDLLKVEYDLSVTHPTWQGHVELNLHTEEAPRITRTLSQSQQ